MESLFTNPVTMAAGAALVSVPIIIHLINRVRFRRVKWAAMEFLLKAQKRMRRKLILQQMLLLLLRCLLVFLVGLLLARFKGFSATAGESGLATAHLVIVDDTPSLAETFTAEGRQTNAFDQAKLQITEKIAPAAAQANTPQSLELLILSDLGNPRNFERLNDSSIQDLKSYLAPLKPSSLRVSLIDGLRRGRELLDRRLEPGLGKVIHIVSDLRAVDWSEDGETLKQLIAELTSSGVQVHLIDVAHPNRKDAESQPRSSDNVGIVEFHSKAAVVAARQPIEFVLRIKNFGSVEVKDLRVEFYVNGRRWNEVSVRIPSIPANQERIETVRSPLGLQRGGDKANPLDRFNLITAQLADPEPNGLAIDNIRHAVVEVRDQLSVLVLEGRQALRDNPKGDGYFLKRLFLDSFGGIEWVDGTPTDLEKKDLRNFAAIYLLNIPALTDVQREKLETFVQDGGGVGFFLGPDVRAADYNKVLYRGGAGLFPVALPDRPTEPPTEEQKNRIGRAFAKQILTRSATAKSSPALAGIYTNDRGGVAKDVDIEKYFNFTHVDQYWPIKRFGKWIEDQAVEELLCLPNEQPMAEFQGTARELLDRLKVKLSEPKFEKYRPYVTPLDLKIRETTASDSEALSVLATHYDRLLCDQINDGDPSEPILREFWAYPDLAELRTAFARERDKTKFGDPLYLVKKFGAGRVAVMTTDAGGSYTTGPWTDWPRGAGAPGWLAVVAEMENYLSGGAVEENRSVGTAISTSFDAAKFLPLVSRTFITADPARLEQSGDIPLTTTALGDQTMESAAGQFKLDFVEARTPGLYLFTVNQQPGPTGEAGKSDFAAYVFNVDAVREGDLRRVNRERLAEFAPNVPVHSPDDSSWVNDLKQKRDDFSTRRWLYLLIALILVAEQALAVKLSFHLRPDDVEVRSPSAAAAFGRGAPLASENEVNVVA